MDTWEFVEYRLTDALAIAWDTCHKIYLLMDEEQIALMREYEYDPLITWEEMDQDSMLQTVKDWYEQSCGLRFIDAVRTVPEGSEDNGFETLIGQGECGCFDECECEDEDDYEEED